MNILSTCLRPSAGKSLPPHFMGSIRKKHTSRGLTLECFYAPDGTLRRKVEDRDGLLAQFDYTFDAQGRLLSAYRNGVLVENYQYNNAGQRYEAWRLHLDENSPRGVFRYNARNRLIAAGETAFQYYGNGALKARRDEQGTTWFAYGEDGLLSGVILPGNDQILYETYQANSINLTRRFKNGLLATEYVWLPPCRLLRYLDYEHMLEFAFIHYLSGKTRCKLPNRMRITPLEETSESTLEAATWAYWEQTDRRERLHELLDEYGGKLELSCVYDQAGALTMLTDKRGRVIKEVLRDSFGVPYYDSFPELFIPIGFAGGLEDPDTGLVRIGYRDYDPGLGRFIRPDFLSAGGGRDLYAYRGNNPLGRLSPLALRKKYALDEFDEKKVKRDKLGRFATQAGGGGGGKPGQATGSGAETDVSNRGTSNRQNRPNLFAGPRNRLSAASGTGAGARAREGATATSLQKWDMDKAIAHLQRRAPDGSSSQNACGTYVREAIEAGGIKLNRSLNPTGIDVQSAYGFGPVLEDAGFITMPEGTVPQAGDVAIFPASHGKTHEHGHIAMFDGTVWRSDFAQPDIYGSKSRRRDKTPFVLYRRP